MSKVLVTGGTRGIGSAIVAVLRGAGYEVISCARGDGADIRCDVTRPEEVARLRLEAGEIDVLVNNAGGAQTAPFLKITEDMWDDQFRLNLKSVYYCIQQFMPGMLERKHGRIINIASTAGKKGYRYISAYVAAKHAIVGLTRALAQEVAAKGVTVNAVCPSFVDTPMVRASLAEVAEKSRKSEEEVLTAYRSFNPQNRFVTPEEVASAVKFLIETPSVNGQAISLCGGETV
jgi:NAD(P)-dependent dehydrogenase (short-subunit alcohol dehydrogenase family)